MLLAPTLLLLLACTGDELVQRVTAGSTTWRTFTVERSLTLDRFELDADSDLFDAAPRMERQEHRRLELVVVDRVEQVDEDGARSFRRTFETVSEETEFSVALDGGPFEPMGGEAESPLEGQTLRFVRAEGGMQPELPEDSELDAGQLEGLLEGLRADLSLAALLPAGPVVQGRSWKIPPDRLEELLRPGGELGLRPAGFEGQYRRRRPPDRGWKGDLEATYRGQRVEGGRTVAIVELEVDVEREEDRTRAGGWSDQSDDGVITPDVLSRVTTTTHEGEGELLWDLEAGQLRSLRLELQTARSVVTESVVVAPGLGDVELTQIDESSGPTVIEVTSTSE